jgi:hypothetical protein
MISRMIGATTVLDNNGRTVAILPPLDVDNPETIEKHILYKMTEHENIYGHLLRHNINYINKKYNYTEDDLDFIFNDNWVIPEGRKSILRSGIFLGLKGDYYAAAHLLAPQFENIFRELAHKCGDVITTLDRNGIEQVKTLGTVFELPNLVECYDEDILFAFKGLLIEKCGSNLRNLIAHGNLESNVGNSNIAVYFVCACLKLLSWYSKESYEIIIKNSKRWEQTLKSKKSVSPEIIET